MLNKGLFLACALALLSACDSSSSGKPETPKPAAVTQAAKPVQDPKVLAERFAGRVPGGDDRVRQLQLFDPGHFVHPQ